MTKTKTAPQTTASKPNPTTRTKEMTPEEAVKWLAKNASMEEADITVTPRKSGKGWVITHANTEESWPVGALTTGDLGKRLDDLMSAEDDYQYEKQQEVDEEEEEGLEGDDDAEDDDFDDDEDEDEDEDDE